MTGKKKEKKRKEKHNLGISKYILLTNSKSNNSRMFTGKELFFLPASDIRFLIQNELASALISLD